MTTESPKLSVITLTFLVALVNTPAYAARTIYATALVGNTTWATDLTIANPSTVNQTVTVTITANGDAKIGNPVGWMGASLQCDPPLANSKRCQTKPAFQSLNAGGTLSMRILTQGIAAATPDSGFIIKIEVAQDAGFLIATAMQYLGLSLSWAIPINGGRPF